MATSSTAQSVSTSGKVLGLNRNICKTPKSDQTNVTVCSKHMFSSEEVVPLCSSLLDWYDSHQRKLPWRDIAKTEKDPDKRGYAVWVSEVMLQQTQVSTVIPYYKKWLEKWPTVKDLASADLEEVNEVWAGLGYYSRAKRLHEGAKIISESYNGCIPETASDLKERIPGIGKYTACAISSMAFNHAVGVVDGNVSRVFSRLRAIGHDVSKPIVHQHLWQLADDVVSKLRPGDFNQALMEFGAVVCTPRNPRCGMCPLSKLCVAYSMAEKSKRNQEIWKPSTSNAHRKGDVICDIENVSGCYLCIPLGVWRSSPDVTTFPIKPKKKKSRMEKIGVVVIESDNRFLMVQRPATGLLAGLWEFPSVPLSEANISNYREVICDWLNGIGIHTSVRKLRKVGEVMHVFSHIRTTYLVEHLLANNSFEISGLNQPKKWLIREEIASAAVSTAVKKILKAVDRKKNKCPAQSSSSTKSKRLCVDKKQTSLKAFLA